MEEEITKSSSILNDLLLNERNFYSNLNVLLVHRSIIKKWEKAMHKRSTKTGWEMCEHILQIGSERFEMHFIKILHVNKAQKKFLRVLISDSQFSFPWEENPTLFIAAAEFHIMKEFIYRYNLKAYILKIEENLGHSINGVHPIKVVSFNQSVSVKLDIIREFKEYRYNKNQGYLYVANALPWQQSNRLRRIRLSDKIKLVVPIILRHLGTLNYTNDLNIMDLLSLRLAISDVRDPSKSTLLNYEIDFLIKRILDSLIKINHLSIRKYLIVKNIKPTGLLIPYFVYEFQHLFQTIDVNFKYQFIGTKSFELHDTIKLKEEIDVVNKLKERFNVNCSIDGRGFDNMSLSLFVDLIKLENVRDITLDTNYRWCDDVFTLKQNRIIPGRKEHFHVEIYLEGENTYNFIERFTTELKTITLGDNSIALNIHYNLNDYKIFDNLNVYKIIFSNIKIDLSMLQNLQQCAIKPSILLINCCLESTSRNWQLINNSERLGGVSIVEDEGTWLSMFEFILEEMHKSNTNEFQFNSKAKFTIKGRRALRGSIDSNSIKFTVDEHNSKLEIICLDTNEVVDLYCRKCEIYQEEKPDYEFYQ